MPDGDADGADRHGYVRSPKTGWTDYYRDLMTCNVNEDGRLLVSQGMRGGWVLLECKRRVHSFGMSQRLTPTPRVEVFGCHINVALANEF